MRKAARFFAGLIFAASLFVGGSGHASDAQYIEGHKRLGHIKSYDLASGRVFVDPAWWSTQNNGKRELAAMMFARHRATTGNPEEVEVFAPDGTPLAEYKQRGFRYRLAPAVEAQVRASVQDLLTTQTVRVTHFDPVGGFATVSEPWWNSLSPDQKQTVVRYLLWQRHLDTRQATLIVTDTPPTRYVAYGNIDGGSVDLAPETSETVLKLIVSTLGRKSE